MYSLDQVIYFLEQRQQTEDWNIRDAAIAYLRGYREILPEYAQMKLDAVNDPLTWDELCKMEDTPVWLEWSSDGQWVLIAYSLDNDIKYFRFCDDRIFVLTRDDYEPDKWQAYRKERE